MELKVVDYRIEGTSAVITLDRPERLNAWTGRMHTEYRWCLDAAEHDPEVRVIVVTGRGRGFCAGADTTALDGHVARGDYDPGADPDELARPGFGVRDEFDADFAFHFGLTKPVIAAVNGAAAGVGLVLACYADLRFAAAGAKLTTAHGKLNLPAEYGLSWLLPRIVGVGRALDLLLTSRVILAEEALEWGLVNRVERAEVLLDETLQFAAELARSVSRGSLAATKWQTYVDLHRDVGASVVDATTSMEAMMREADFGRGVAALRERRSPDFS